MRYVLLGLLFLSGCIADNKTKQEATHNDTVAPTVVMPAAVVEKSLEATGKELIAKVQTEQANNNAQLSGMVTGMIHQLKLDFEALVKVQATAVANIKTEFDSVVKASVDLKTEVLRQASILTQFNAQLKFAENAQLTVNAKLAEQVSLLSGMQLKIDKLEAQNAAAAAVLAGYQNQFEQVQQTLTAKAGHDVNTNYLPVEAVNIIKNIVYMMIGIVTILCGVATTVISLSFKSARERVELQHTEQLVENKRLIDIIVSILPRAAESKSGPFIMLTPTGTTLSADQSKPSG